MKNNKLWIGLLIIVFLVVVLIGSKNQKNQTNKNQNEDPSIEETVENEENNNETTVEHHEGQESEVPHYFITVPAQPNENNVTLSLPLQIPNSTIRLEKLSSYEGIYLEDGSNLEIQNVAAIVISNVGNQTVEYASIEIQCGSQLFSFNATSLLANQSMVVLEATKQPYKNQTIQSVKSSEAYLEASQQFDNKIEIQEVDGYLVVTNLTDQQIPGIRIFYKYYLDEEHVYIGGITYTAKINDLEAHGKIKINPSHYEKGYSKIVMTRTYEVNQ